MSGINPTPKLLDGVLYNFLNQIRNKVNRSIEFPVYTTTQRDAITDWREGETIYTTGVGLQIRISGSWTTI